jgi:TRAP-type uncharacterized transport system substrate-binding protein
MSRSFVLAMLCGIVAIACLGGGALFFIERPTVVRVAVPNDNTGDNELLSAASKVVRHGHHPIRCKSASDLLDKNGVDMAVVRTDAAMPAQGQTVVILHRDAAVLIVPQESEIKDVADLAGHTVGIVGSSDNGAVLDTILQQYDLDVAAVKRVALQDDDAIGDAVGKKAVDAVLVVGVISGDLVQTAVKAVAKAGGGAPTFLPVSEADAIAQRSPAYDSFEVVKGAFHGAPPLPGENFDTLSVTHRLVASSILSDTVVADVTRFFLGERSALVALDPLARRIEAPPTDKGAALPAHPGTQEYIDDEEESFLDQYSDYIYLGAMFFGVLASGATALFSRLSAQGVEVASHITERLVEILKLVRRAPSLDALDALEAETDDMVAATLERTFARGLDERSLSTLGLAFDQVRGAVRERRQSLETAAVPPPRMPALVEAR